MKTARESATRAYWECSHLALAGSADERRWAAARLLIIRGCADKKLRDAADRLLNAMYRTEGAAA